MKKKYQGLPGVQSLIAAINCVRIDRVNPNLEVTDSLEHTLSNRTSSQVSSTFDLRQLAGDREFF